ncbi:MAG: transglycosylase SLT domain-containing protein [Vicingus serpentipes]|nr:transglycosylase SLT domain-containing protein [Vicingus serpentipes]
MKYKIAIILIGFLSFFWVSFSAPNNDYVEIVQVAGANDTINYHFVANEQLYEEGWDKLAQPNFWRILIGMGNDSALLNIGSTRQIITKIAVSDWKKLGEQQQDNLRDSVRNYYFLPSDERIYLTTGKKAFYDFKRIMPSIGKGIQVFNENGVDPFYAQAILLIESPNKLQKSSVGAYGSFQIMRRVAINMGLKVNKYVDERKDFDKSAWAAAKLIRTICIPELNKILDERCIEYNSSDTWYRLLVLHVYHAGAGNVKHAIAAINPTVGNMELITQLWQTEAAGFRNASQNYSQLALATMLELDRIIYNDCDYISCFLLVKN